MSHLHPVLDRLVQTDQGDYDQGAAELGAKVPQTLQAGDCAVRTVEDQKVKEKNKTEQLQPGQKAGMCGLPEGLDLVVRNARQVLGFPGTAATLAAVDHPFHVATGLVPGRDEAAGH